MTDLVPREDDENLPPAAIQILSGLQRSFSALEALAAGLAKANENQQRQLDLLSKKLDAIHAGNKEHAIMSSQAASEAEALASLGQRITGPMRPTKEGEGSGFGTMEPEVNPRF